MPSTLGDCDLGGTVTQNVAVLPDGTAFGAWECNEGGSHVYASRFVSGSGWSTPVVLSAERLAWDEVSTAPGAGPIPEIPGSWSSPHKLDAPVLTDADGSPKHLDGASSVAHEFASSVPVLAMNASGDALVTWVRTDGISQSVQAIALAGSSSWGFFLF